MPIYDLAIPLLGIYNRTGIHKLWPAGQGYYIVYFVNNQNKFFWNTAILLCIFFSASTLYNRDFVGPQIRFFTICPYVEKGDHLLL